MDQQQKAALGWHQRVGYVRTASGNEFDAMAGHYMTIVMETGQMAGVPWVVVQDYTGRETLRINCAHIEQIRLDTSPHPWPFEKE